MGTPKGEPRHRTKEGEKPSEPRRGKRSSPEKYEGERGRATANDAEPNTGLPVTEQENNRYVLRDQKRETEALGPLF